MQSMSASPPPMAGYPRAKVDSSTQTEEPLPFTALLDRTLDRIEANVPLNLSAITFHIRRQHLSRIEQLESLLSQNILFRFLLHRLGVNPRHLFGLLSLLVLLACRQLYRRNRSLATNLCAVAYPAYASIRTINSDPVLPPKGLVGLENAAIARASRSFYNARSISSQRSSSLSLVESARGSILPSRQQQQQQRQQQQNRRSTILQANDSGSLHGAGEGSGSGRDPTRRYSRRLNAKKRMSSSTVYLDDAQHHHHSAPAGYYHSSSGVDDLESSSGGRGGRRVLSAASWGTPSIRSITSEGEYCSSNYYDDDDEDGDSGGGGSLTAEERMHQRMRRRWNLLMQQRKDKATRQWLAYWSIYGTVQVLDTWSTFWLDWIPGYHLGKLLFLWWAQRRGATLVFDYFQPLIQTKSKDGREIARRSSRASLRSMASSSSVRQRHHLANPLGSTSSPPLPRSRSARNSLQVLAQQEYPSAALSSSSPFYTTGSTRRETAGLYQQQQQQHYHHHSPQPYSAHLQQQLNQATHHHRFSTDDNSSDDQGHISRSMMGGQHFLASPIQETSGGTGGASSTTAAATTGVFGGSSTLFESGESVWSAAPAASSKISTATTTATTSTTVAGMTSHVGLQTLDSIYSRAEDGVTPTPQDFGSPVSLHQQLRQAGYRQQLQQ